MTPIERAARVIAELAGGGPWERMSEPHRESYIDEARAVIAAIREPSEAMVQAYADGIDKDACISPEAYWIRDDGFSAMIDALLEEGA